MVNFIFAGIIILIVGAAVTYIVKKKKRGAVCIGCPAAGTCSRANQGVSCSCGCSCEDECA